MVKVFRQLKRKGRKTAPEPSKEEHIFIGDSAIPSESASTVSWRSEGSLTCSTQLTPTNDKTPCETRGLQSNGVARSNSQENDLSSLSNKNEEIDSSLAIVLFNKPRPVPPPLPDSFKIWLHSASALLESKEMETFFGSSMDVITSAVVSGKQAAVSTGGLVVKAACLPVTIPLHMACATTNLVFGITGNVIHMALGTSSGGESTSSRTPAEGLIHNVFNAVPFVLNSAQQISKDVGSAALHNIVEPVLGIEEEKKGKAVERSTNKCITKAGESSAEKEDFLDRLRLDNYLPSSHSKTPKTYTVSTATSSDVSKYLLRVDDLNVLVSPDPATPMPESRALYIDLGKEFSDESVTKDGLQQLIHRGLDIAATNVSGHIEISDVRRQPSLSIEWKPEGNTGRHIRRMKQLSTQECYKKLQSDVLVWSGKYSGPKHYGSGCPLFMARGVVKRSPRGFLNMLWDSSRTQEYNNFSLGRTDVLVIDDDIFDGGSNGAKVIKSETKVPFTGMSVTLTALMHAQALEEGPDEGFIIVSRSLNSGMAGQHVGSSKRVEQSVKNEILLGVNIMRPVPGHPELTDLMSVSQVGTNMVPQFLAFRIGMMGVEDFFKNVR